VRVHRQVAGATPHGDGPHDGAAACVEDAHRLIMWVCHEDTRALLVHRDLAEKLKSARVWGTGVFDGQTVTRDHVLHDKDTVELHA